MSNCVDILQGCFFFWCQKLTVTCECDFSYFLTDRSNAVLFGNCVMCLHLLYCLVCFLQRCGHLLGKGKPLVSLLCEAFLCVLFAFPYGVLCQVWYLIVLIPDICLLLYFFMSNYL